ncbi:MAG: TldD/PmbA family protein [Nitrospirae bacterium]|nr:TldD/PmbA family protein [Nitrospirota bacterium]
MSLDPGMAADIVSRALRGGADQAEVFFKSYRNVSAEIKDQAVESLSTSFSSGYAVRVIRNNRLGFSFSTEIRDSGEVVMRALEAAGSVDEDPLLTFAQASPASEVLVFDDAVRDVNEDDAIRMAMLVEKAAYETDDRIKRVRKPAASFTVSETVIANSCGVAARYQATSCSAQITAVAESGYENQTGWDFMGSRFLKDVSFEQVGRTAAAAAVRLLGSRKMQGMKTDVILDNAVANDFLGVFASSLSSDAVQKGKSLLADRVGTAIISARLNIIDSGLLPGRLGSKPLDDEGSATQTTPLVHEGVLRSYLFNTYTARKGNAASTGNAVRGSFTALPGVGVTNLFIEPSGAAASIPRDRLFGALGKGLYIVDAMGVHTANPISGDFSIGVSGIWIENGKAAYPVKEAVISGNLLDFFNKVSGVSDDLRFYGALGSPSLIISDVDVSA